MPDAELTDMKLPKKAKSDDKAKPMMPGDDAPDYPYGLRLSLGNDELKKLPSLKKAAIKNLVTIRATGHIVAMRSNETPKGEDKSLDIQIEKLAINGDEETEFSAAFESKEE